MTKDNCNICQKHIFKISPKRNITTRTKLDWEFDSTFKLSGFKKAKCFLGFCISCIQISHYPLFNTNKLYTKNGFQVRKKIYEKYFHKKYDKKSKKILLKNEFDFAKNEFMRFEKISNFITKNSKKFYSNKIDILDFGGGDGYVSQSFKNVIEANSNIDVNINNFDPMKWKKTSNKFKKKKFDLIIMSHVIEHLNNPVVIIKKLKQEFLKKRGIIFVEVPDERTRFIKLLGSQKIGLHYHVTQHSRNSLKKIFEINQFDFVKTKYNYLSSYRGEKIKTIFCLAQNNNIKKNIKLKTSFKTYVYEFLSFFSLCIFSIKKVFN